MSKYDSAILDVNATSNGGYIQGGASTTVFLDGHPVVLEGSASESGAVVLSLSNTSTIVIEGRHVAKPGDALSDGSVLLPRAP